MLSFDLELDGLSPEPVTKQSFSPPRPAGSGQSDYCNQRRDGDVHLLTPNPMNDSLDRRNFLKQAGAAGIGLGMAGYFSPLARASVPATAVPARKISANDTITAAVIGTNARGLAHIDCLTKLPGGQNHPHMRRGQTRGRERRQGRGQEARLRTARLGRFSQNAG